ncbi:MAG TPA: class I SAM-dependent methyltransferase [Bryobacteraceae bacterium]|jgi:SAM-dependent methyltransferase|nr:class I SAM-dependent methyltransferase [Bryobacteraceae bacterium]
MKQNKYDDPEFFARYSEIPRSIHGLESAGEWPFFRELLPDLRGKRLLDLGCGFGWHCRYAREQGALFAVGVELSARMLSRAKQATNDPAIEYRQCAIEDAGFQADEFDVAISSLALHYVERFDTVCRNVYRWLKAGGAFVFSVEHPIYTALAAQQWCLGPSGEQLHWPVDDYQEEGPRHARWFVGDVIKYHRTLATYVNTLVDSGFSIAKVVEPAPTPEILFQRPEWKDERRRPTFLVVATVKG